LFGLEMLDAIEGFARGPRSSIGSRILCARRWSRWLKVSLKVSGGGASGKMVEIVERFEDASEKQIWAIDSRESTV
jgi:hypothetical protein